MSKVNVRYIVSDVDKAIPFYTDMLGFKVHTQNIDSFWSLLKRGIMGQFHHVSKSYLPLYINEFSWRHNNRKNPSSFADLLTTCGK